MKNLFLLGLFSVLAFSANAEEDEHGHGGHAGDVIIHAEGTELHIESGIPLANGGFLFESDFDLHNGHYESEAPGFDLETGYDFSIGNALAYSVQGPLQFWGGASWGSAGSDSVSIINGALPADEIIVNSSSSYDLSIIDVSTDGGVHTHVDFELSDNASNGAYLVELVLKGFSDSGLQTELFSSDSVFIAFNHGLSEELFELSVDAMSPVPVPAAWLFLASGLGSLLLGRRLRA
ncbi:MAG: hypothetical protein CL692_00985 [Cellvibrionales bacterium]|nr:hypothetical protein [Cellvibrionales bacterium]